MNCSLSDVLFLIKYQSLNQNNLQEEYVFVELIMNLAALGVATLKILFAIPVLGVLVLLSIFGPMLVKRIKRW